MSKNSLSRHIFSAIFFIMLLAGFSGCNNMTGDNTKSSADGKAYLSINVVSAGRTALPQFTVSSISDFQFTIEGKGPGATDFSPLTTETNTNGIYSSLSALTSAAFPIETGAWTFKLTASKDGTVLRDQITQTITTGTNSISFDLVWDDTSFSGTGDLSFTFDFSAAPNATDVTFATTELLAYNSSTGEYETSVAEASIGFDNSKVIYAPSNLNAGNYKIIIRLYGDTQKKNLMFTWPELAIITGGQTSTGSRTITSLNELYDINWHNLDLEGVSAPTTLPLKYTRFSDEYTLPTTGVSKTGTIFGGWYSDSDYQTTITKIPANSTGTIDIYARFIDSIYIKDGGDAYTDGVDGTTEATALDSIDSAIFKIIEYAEPSVNWKIIVVGEVKGTQNIDNALTTAQNAASLTIKGKTGNTTDILNANVGDTATTTGSALTVQTTVPVTIQNLKITGGNTTNGGGGISINNGASVTLESGTEISGNKAEGSAGGAGICCRGTLIMNNGLITSNIATNGTSSSSLGGGVCVSGSSNNPASFTMYNGTIEGNSSNEYGGGGVGIITGTFTMEGGTISGNEAGYQGGGGVFATSKATFIMKGGTISGNTSTRGGGISVGASGSCNLEGGLIQNNTATSNGGAICSRTTKTFSIKGNVSIPYGGSEKNNDIYLYKESVNSPLIPITIAGELTFSSTIALDIDDYTNSPQVIKLADVPDPTTTLAYACSKFQLIKYNATINSSDGKISPVIATVAGTPYFTQTTAYNAIKGASGSNVAVVLGAGCTQAILGNSVTTNTLANAIKSTNATKIALSVASGVTITIEGDCSYMFNGCSKLISADLKGFDTTDATEIYGLFYNCEYLTSVDLSSFNTSKVSNMIGMFENCTRLQSIDITNFDTTNCQSIQNLFSGCSTLTSIDLSNFDTSKVDNFQSLFANCSNLTQLDLTNFTIGSNFFSSYGMFMGCTNLQKIIVSSDFNLADNTSVTMSDNMFDGCEALAGGASTPTQWASGNPTDKTYAKIDGGTSDPGYFTQVYAKVGKTTCMNKTETKTAITAIDSTTTPEITITLYNGVTASDLGMAQSGGGILASMNNKSDVNMHLIVDQNANIVIENGAGEAMFLGLVNLLSADLRGFNTSAATRMGTMFSECYHLVELNLSSFDTSSVVDMEGMFSYCYDLPQLDLSSFDTSNVTDCMNYMFQDCSNLETIYVTTAFVTTNASEVNNMFDGCSTKLTGGSGTTWNASNPKDNTYARIDDPTNSRPGYFTQVKLGSKDSPTAVGDIVFNDGSAISYTPGMSLSPIRKNNAIAVIFYNGTDLNNDGTTTQRLLGVALERSGSQIYWCTSEAQAYNVNVSTIECPYEGTTGNQTFSGVKNGSSNLEKIGEFLEENSGTTDDTGTEDNYPAFYYAIHYGTNKANIAGTSYENGWYLPSIAELYWVYKLWSDTEKPLDSIIELVDGTKFVPSGTTANTFISSTNQASTKFATIEVFGEGRGDIQAENKNGYFYVCPIRQFN